MCVCVCYLLIQGLHFISKIKHSMILSKNDTLKKKGQSNLVIYLFFVLDIKLMMIIKK